MIRLSKRTQYLIVFLIFGISVGIGLKKSNLMKQTTVSLDTSKANKIFKEEKNMKKVQIVYNTNKDKDIIPQIDKILNDENVIVKFSEMKGNYYTKIFEFPNAVYNDISSKLRQIKGLSQENVETNENAEFDINIDEHLKNNRFLIEKTKEDISKRRTRSTEKLNDSNRLLKKLQMEIDSLNYIRVLQKHNKDYTLVFLTVIQNDKTTSVSYKMKVFVQVTFISLLLFILGLILFYLFILLITKLMVVLGIRTLKESGGSSYSKYYRGSYGGSSGYSRYYRPYRNKRKRTRMDKATCKRSRRYNLEIYKRLWKCNCWRYFLLGM